MLDLIRFSLGYIVIVLSALRAKLSCNTYLLELLNCFHTLSILGKNLNSLVSPFSLFVCLTICHYFSSVLLPTFTNVS